MSSCETECPSLERIEIEAVACFSRANPFFVSPMSRITPALSIPRNIRSCAASSFCLVFNSAAWRSRSETQKPVIPFSDAFSAVKREVFFNARMKSFFFCGGTWTCPFEMEYCVSSAFANAISISRSSLSVKSFPEKRGTKLSGSFWKLPKLPKTLKTSAIRADTTAADPTMR